MVQGSQLEQGLPSIRSVVPYPVSFMLIQAHASLFKPKYLDAGMWRSIVSDPDG